MPIPVRRKGWPCPELSPPAEETRWMRTSRSMPLRVEPTTRMAYTSSSDNSEDETREPRCGENVAKA